ncbi:MAG: hypothetical protein WCG04_00060 [Alphaproteobacteria bacterium]
MTPDSTMPLDDESVVAVSPKKRCLWFCVYNALVSFAFLLLVVVFIPRWITPVGDWLFPYVKQNQIGKWKSELSSLTLALEDLKPQEVIIINGRLQSLEEKMLNILESHDFARKGDISESPQLSPESYQASHGEQSYFMEVLLLCQEIEGRLLKSQDYKVPLALLTELLKTPEERVWLAVLSSDVADTKTHADAESLTANWPRWLKPVQNFLTIQPLTDKTPSEQVDKMMALQKLKDVCLANYQKTLLSVVDQESAS